MTNYHDDLLPDNLQKKQTTTVGTFFASLLFLIGVIWLAIYLSKMLWGTNSLEVLFSLQNEQKDLTTNIYTLKKENAALQKEYLEYKNLMPNEEIK